VARAPKQTIETPNFDADHVKVRCIVDNRPWTHEKPLANGEEATVPLAIAETLLARKHVELCE
jgi:hypothetical protein